MPVAPTFPGVYIEEVPSGVHTIIGVATSITLFAGRTERGLVTDSGVSVFSFDDFSRQFGSLSIKFPMTFAVRDFFMNGGSQAIIVRVSGASAAPSVCTQLNWLAASSPGEWADKL